MKARVASVSRLRDINWDFVGARSESEFSALHWHPCRFVSQIPAGLISLLSDDGDVVLDPFLGSGTTLVEAQRLKRRGVGVEINPVAAMIASAKTIPKRQPLIKRTLQELADLARVQLEGDLLRPRKSMPLIYPATVQMEKWYMPEVGRQLSALWALLSGLRGDSSKLGCLAFSSILIRVCRETRHWGYICDNTMPLSSRRADVLAEFHRSLSMIERAYAARELYIRPGERLRPAQVINGDALVELARLKGSVNLVVTSPPYFGVSDYAKAQRLTAEWMGADVENVRLKEIGARSKRHRKDAYESYMDELVGVMDACREKLVYGGFCCLVVGESRSRRGYIAQLHDAMEGIGFHVVHLVERVVSEQRRQNPSILSEQIAVYRKVR
ncbi:site-specific DNA-methyltransferase [Xanthomonas sp. CFBP 8703]|uniref:Methyltransferase n=1 Tax=Xanthomonas bonasiae TaxID=2810351 RepID=A0ABS3B2W0_9XANT|nr:DNA methyltransferase [Xanthomonas bonasiae]MBN6102938.1 site-specific DNA-methyltransferase [Xanthomonas bonasiae]